MKRLAKALQRNKQIRVLGVDDGPFDKRRDTTVNIAGIICSNTRFEGMLWMAVQRDGNDATQVLARAIVNSKFYSQLHVILLDGIAVGGFNIIDLPRLSHVLQLPCIGVMRRMPNLAAIDQVLQRFDDYEQRKQLMEQAGEIYQIDGFVYQTAGCDVDLAAKALRQATDVGKVPEALRLAHLIGAAVKLGESGKRA